MIIFGSILAIIMIALAFQDYRTFRKKEIPHEDYKSSIIGIGIFGTFFGIIAGLWDFDNSSTAAIERSVPLLLEGLKTAFLTSLFGMGLTTFLGIIQKKGEVQKDSSETDLVLKSLFEMSENMKASQKMVSQGFQDLQDVISTNGRNLSENMENLQKGISKSNQNLQNIVSENGKNLSENMKAGQKMISQGFQDLQDVISTNGRNLSENMENLQNGISKSNQELQNGILESNQNLQNRISEKLNILGNIHKTQEDMSKQVFSINAYSTHLESLDNNVSELTKMILQNAMKLKINENSEYWTKIFNEMATVSEELEIYKKRVLELEEKLKDSEDLLLEIQNSSGQNVSELQNRVSELQNQLEKLKNENESLVSEKEKMVSELLEKIEKLENEIRECVENSNSDDKSWINGVVKWSKEFDLGLPESWEELQKVRGIISVGFDYTKEEYENNNPTVDTTNFYFANTKNKKITYIPKEIGNLTNLTSLYLDSNQIKELPKEIGNLTNLTSLDLGNNQIKELPKEIGNLTNLTSLDLYKNQIKELPKEIGNLTNLTELYLTSNQIKELPKEIGNLTNLTSLYLWDNQISSSEKEKIKKLLPNFEIYF